MGSQNNSELLAHPFDHIYHEYNTVNESDCRRDLVDEIYVSGRVNEMYEVGLAPAVLQDK